MNTLYDDIRPYANSELQAALRTVLENKEFEQVISIFAPHIDFAEIKRQVPNFHTLLDFQKAFIAPIIQMLVDKLCTSLTSSGLENLKGVGIIMSNHRDIVMDPSFLCLTLINNGIDSCEVGIGDNLLKNEWIKILVRANKCFLVKRGLTPRDMAKTFIELSSYINHTIKDNGNSVWIAQREGRAKDSNDRTQESILKMFAISGKGSFIENLKAINICPLSISYEYDPCDYLKAKEFQQKRDNPDFVKGEKDDFLSMQTGINGYKGAVHYAFTPIINHRLEEIERTTTNKKEQATAICRICDEQIFSAYRIYPVNMIAYDRLRGSSEFVGKYSVEEFATVDKYFARQLDRIEMGNKDEKFLMDKLLEMYAMPLINQLSV